MEQGGSYLVEEKEEGSKSSDDSKRWWTSPSSLQQWTRASLCNKRGPLLPATQSKGKKSLLMAQRGLKLEVSPSKLWDKYSSKAPMQLMLADIYHLGVKLHCNGCWYLMSISMHPLLVSSPCILISIAVEDNAWRKLWCKGIPLLHRIRCIQHEQIRNECKQCLLTQGSVDAVTSDNLQLPLGYTYLIPSKVDQRQLKLHYLVVMMQRVWAAQAMSFLRTRWSIRSWERVSWSLGHQCEAHLW